MRKVILYRGADFERDELHFAEAAGFYCVSSRLDCKPDDLVVCRYSCLPFYRELEQDIIRIGAKLIITHAHHRYIADLGNWYEDLKDMTPATWRAVTDIPWSEHGPFVVKGETNSKKFQWDTHMFAATRADLGRVIGNLQDDGLIGHQQLYIRKYVPLRKLADGLHCMPITEEYRVFVLDGHVVGSGFYWASHAEEIEDLTQRTIEELTKNGESAAIEMAGLVLMRVHHSRGLGTFVVDVGIQEDGQAVVIELNDLQMSGLSMVDPSRLYRFMWNSLKSW